MKRLILTLTLTIILSFNVAYCQEATISIATSMSNIKLKDVITVNVLLEDAAKIRGVDINLDYDSGYLTPVDEGFIKGELLENKDFFIAKNEIKANSKIRFLGALYGSQEPIEGNGQLLSIKFKAIKPGTTSLQLNDIKLVRENLTKVDVAIHNKDITIHNSHRSKDRRQDSHKEDINISGINVDNIAIKRGIIPNNINLDMLPVSNIYEITGSLDIEEDLRTHDSLTLSIEYNITEDIDEEKLGIYYYNDKGKWVYAGGEIDREAKRISTKINRFGQYMVSVNPYLKNFNDMEGHWSTTYVKRLTGMNVIKGYDDNSFKPYQGITRQEFAKIIVAALDLEGRSKALDFKDNDSIQSWARDYILIAQGHNILSGYEDGTFRPDKPMSRVEIATALGRLLEGEDIGVLVNFTDKNKLPNWSFNEINKCIYYGILSGYEDNTIRPNNIVNRAEAAKMIYQLLWVLGI